MGGFLNAISGIASALGPVGSLVSGGIQTAEGLLNYQNQQANVAYQKQQQQVQYQREDDAVQRRVADLKAAGLNPTLAAGSAAQAGPVVSTTAPQVSGVESAAKGVTDASQVAMGLMSQKQNIAQSASQVALLNAQADKARTDAAVASATKDANIQTTVNSAQLSSATLQASIQKAIADSEKSSVDLVNSQLDSQAKALGIQNQQKDLVRLDLTNRGLLQNLSIQQQQMVINQVAIDTAQHNLKLATDAGVPTTASANYNDIFSGPGHTVGAGLEIAGKVARVAGAIGSLFAH